MQEIFMRRDRGGEREREGRKAMAMAAVVSVRNEVAVFIEESF